MEQVDRGLQERVWQRVQSAGAPKDREEPLRLTGELMGHYRKLAAGSSESHRLFRRLFRQMQTTGRTLLGLCRLCGLGMEEAAVSRQSLTPRQRIVRCCHLERRLGEALEALEKDPQWGHIYGRLAEAAWGRSLLLLEILGSQKDRGK